MSVGLSGHIARARRRAQKHGQVFSTAHVLSVLMSDERVNEFMAGYGVSELQVLEALSMPQEEPLNAVDLAEERAKRAAEALAARAPEPIHLLLAIVREPRSAGYRCLDRIGVQPMVLRNEMLSKLQAEAPRPSVESSRWTATAALGVPQRHRAKSVRANVRTRPREPREDQVKLAEATESKLGRRTRRQSEETSPGLEKPARVPDGRSQLAPGPQQEEALGAPGSAPEVLSSPADAYRLDPEQFPLLTGLGRNLTALAAEGAFDPVIGRDGEIEQLLDVLSRRRANNPLLVGPSGVGKTAIVEGLSRVLVGLAETELGAEGIEGSVLVELSPGALLGGTGVRGALSERIATLRDEVLRAEGKVILFFDEVHMLVGSQEGSDSLGNELKTALSRGELPCIGATTSVEYRRVFERDSALSRRFTRIEVDEPRPDAALAILRGVARCYELHHTVAVSSDALRAAVDLSVRYVHDGQLPDKAIGILDQASARVRRRAGTTVTVDAIAQVVSERTGVPVDRLLQRDGDVLLGLEEALGDRVKGQSKAVDAIARSLRKSAVGFAGRRPLGTFLFLGSTGVGKTEMAKAINDLLFPGSTMVRIDMSELSESHSVARLLGAPPGYVGHDDGGQLTEPVRQRPYRLVLLDEVEKAHPEVLLSLLPLLDEGQLSDARGRVVDFTNTVIVMTSNLGAHEKKRSRPAIGFGGEAGQPSEPVDPIEAQGQQVLAAARAALPPELWNRIEEPLYFRPLSAEAVADIAQAMLARAVETVEDRHRVELKVDPSAVDALLAAGGYDPELGARPMRRTVGRLVEAMLANALLEGRLKAGMRARLRGDGKRVVLDVIGADAAE